MQSRQIKVGKKYIQAILIKLSHKNLIILLGSKGYIMCGYLNLTAANKFKEVAVKIVKVSTIAKALKAKTHSVTYAAKQLGIYRGQPIKDVLKIIA
ncbi:MAG: DUF1805 domain-containing protein [Candidatus Omnitrophica bacterium]|jgi:uncharacterized protein YunC (DUF1805 family)|nr:DUF1805 domain-containing protein [Candidatus Omnitrophota bacterium]